MLTVTQKISQEVLEVVKKLNYFQKFYHEIYIGKLLHSKVYWFEERTHYSPGE